MSRTHFTFDLYRTGRERRPESKVQRLDALYRTMEDGQTDEPDALVF
jgi:hypothetical protein